MNVKKSLNNKKAKIKFLDRIDSKHTLNEANSRKPCSTKSMFSMFPSPENSFMSRGWSVASESLSAV